jgi:hypothetical protein
MHPFEVTKHAPEGVDDVTSKAADTGAAVTGAAVTGAAVTGAGVEGAGVDEHEASQPGQEHATLSTYAPLREL